MRRFTHLLLGGLCAGGLLLRMLGGVPVAHASTIDLRIFQARGATGPLTPGSRFTAVVRGLGAPGGAYCLGLTSMHDRYGLPVSLGSFQPVDDGLMAVQARVPARVFPAEPAGPFLLFVGRCTTVAPDGIYGTAVVTIVPAGH